MRSIALVMATFICCKNVSSESKVIPKMFGCFAVGSVSLFNRLIDYPEYTRVS